MLGHEPGKNAAKPHQAADFKENRPDCKSSVSPLAPPIETMVYLAIFPNCFVCNLSRVAI